MIPHLRSSLSGPLFCNDSLCDQYHQYYACTVSWDFHGLCTNPRMGCIPLYPFEDGLLLHGSQKAAVKEGTAIDESKAGKDPPTRGSSGFGSH